MSGRLLRLTGTLLLITVALVTPTVVVMSAPASADMVVDGCTIVANPTFTNFTKCPGADFAGADLTGVNLSYANLAGASFVDCYVYGMEEQCTAANLADANLTNADLSDTDFFQIGQFTANPSPAVDVSGANFSQADLSQADLDTDVDFSGDNLSGATLTGDTLGDSFVDANLSGANLTGVSMGYEFESFGIPANLTGANFTNTILVPSSQTVTATSQAGAVATWATPAGIPGATPGACTPPSGSTFPLFTTTVTCQVLDADGDVATGTFEVTVQPTSQYFTRVLVPSDGAVLAGRPYLDAEASDGPGVTKVVFELSGGAISGDQVIATATRTYLGWLAQWDSAAVPNGTYSLQSVATDAANTTDTSTAISVTVNNQPPATAVLVPSGGASVSGAAAVLDASASSAVGLASVTFEVSGATISGDQVVASATSTLYGWVAQWNTTTVPNGTYNLQSVATDTVAESTSSGPVSITVDNAAPTTTVLIPSNTATESGTAALLDASASANVTSVSFELSGGTISGDLVISAGFSTRYGWLGQWNTTSVSNGPYTLESVASYAGGVSGTSPPITISIGN